MNAEKEVLYAKKSNVQTRDARELQAKVKMLERSLSQVVCNVVPVLLAPLIHFFITRKTNIHTTLHYPD